MYGGVKILPHAFLNSVLDGVTDQLLIPGDKAAAS
jgi:hypothetical protein